jgi:hypothetical protein
MTNMQIRIKSTPPGEAPEHIRQAWIGLVLPVPRVWAGPRKFRTAGVLSGPKNPFGVFLALLQGRLKREAGYVVASDKAVEILGRQAPEAAAWWRQNAPGSIARGKYFVFAEDACEVVQEQDDMVELSGARKFLGRLLAVIAGLFIFTGICSLFYADSIHKADWGLAVVMIVFGVFLGFCAARLIRPTS